MTEAAPTSPAPAPSAPPAASPARPPPIAPVRPARAAAEPAPSARPAPAPAEPSAVERWSESPQARHARQLADQAAADPWLSSGVLTRGPDGRLRVDGRPVDGQADPATGDQPAPAEPAAAEKRRVGGSVNGFDATDDEIIQWRSTAAAEQSRRANTPADSSGYLVELSSEWKPPAGFETYKPEVNHPLMSEARQFAAEAGLTQQQFSKMLTLSAAKEVGTAMMLEKARDGEIKKLGANGSLRVTAIENFLSAEVGDAAFRAIRPLLATAKMIEVLEHLQRKVSGGGGSFSPSRGAENRTATISDAEWNSMSYHARKEYASKFGR
jgi:hypothetical protein